jgi:hypothetical protein
MKRSYDVLRMTRKGGKRDVLVIHPETVQRIHTYCDAAGHGADLDGPLFRPLNPNGKGQSVRRHLDFHRVVPRRRTGTSRHGRVPCLPSTPVRVQRARKTTIWVVRPTPRHRWANACGVAHGRAQRPEHAAACGGSVLKEPADAGCICGASLSGPSALYRHPADRTDGVVPWRVDSICLTGRHVTPFQAAIAFYPWCLPRMQQLNAPLLILIGEADNWTPASRYQDMLRQSEPLGNRRSALSRCGYIPAPTMHLVVSPCPASTMAIPWADTQRRQCTRKRRATPRSAAGGAGGWAPARRWLHGAGGTSAYTAWHGHDRQSAARYGRAAALVAAVGGRTSRSCLGRGGDGG